MKLYSSLFSEHTLSLKKLKKQHRQISAVRLLIAVTFLFSGYQYFSLENELLFIPFGISLIGFIVLMKIHQKISWDIQLTETLIEINQNEIDFVEGNSIPFYDGIEYNDHSHFYAHDLDIFGSNSLYQNINRTATYIGQKKLAQLLLSLLPQKEIKQNQEAIKELSDKVEWRQSILALAKISKDSKSSFEKLLFWANNNSDGPSKKAQWFSLIAPILLGLSIIGYFMSYHSVFGNLILSLFIFNLVSLGAQKKRIEREIMDSGKIHEILKHYSLIIQSIEQQGFQSERLKQLQQQLIYKSETASIQIQSLSRLFSDMDSIHNVVGLVVFNGLFQYHVHILKHLLHWKKEHASEITSWLDCIGEIETLNSLANFSYNNQDFTFPDLNSGYKINMNNLGHPLLKSTSRITNSVDFSKQRFIILTGSNMSGKSTFLRTLGINMVLTGIGSPICASSATIHPLPVLVSMRLSDSLNDSESYFFAEVKRLKEIITQLKGQKSFVLLDEILRGTNSDDKRSGTINVIKKIIEQDAIGAIATHDLEVCLTTNEYPDVLTNKCFEVEIVNDNLHFDYKLRDGICKNKSATFLMKKMEIF